MTRSAETAEVVRTRRLEVMDEDDVVRIALYCQRDLDGDSAFVEVRDPKGGLAVHLGNDGETTLVECWQRGNPVITVICPREGRTSLEVRTPDTWGTAVEWHNDGTGGDGQ